MRPVAGRSKSHQVIHNSTPVPAKTGIRSRSASTVEPFPERIGKCSMTELSIDQQRKKTPPSESPGIASSTGPCRVAPGSPVIGSAFVSRARFTWVLIIQKAKVRVKDRGWGRASLSAQCVPFLPWVGEPHEAFEGRKVFLKLHRSDGAPRKRLFPADTPAFRLPALSMQGRLASINPAQQPLHTMKIKQTILFLAAASALILSGCTAAGSAQGSGTTTTTKMGHSTTTTGSGQVSGSGSINRN